MSSQTCISFPDRRVFHSSWITYNESKKIKAANKDFTAATENKSP